MVSTSVHQNGCSASKRRHTLEKVLALPWIALEVLGSIPRLAILSKNPSEGLFSKYSFSLTPGVLRHLGQVQ
jgi:hypothetical protein